MTQFQRPTEIKIDDTKVFAELSVSNDIINKETGRVVDIHIAPTLVETELDSEGQLYNLPISPDILTSDKFKKFNNLTYSLGKINRLAEMNVDHLQSFIRHYFSLYPYAETVNNYQKCKEYSDYNITDNFSKLSYMQLRNLFSCIIKSDSQFYDIEELNTGEKRNYITRTYADYVYDRDCYTHGQLFFYYPTFNPIMRVKPPNKKEHYISLPEDVLWDNLLIFKLLENVLRKLGEALDKNRM